MPQEDLGKLHTDFVFFTSAFTMSHCNEAKANGMSHLKTVHCEMLITTVIYIVPSPFLVPC